MLAFLGGLESVSEVFELALGDWALSHCETDTELGGSDVARAQSIEIAEELRDTNSLLFAESANASNNIIDVIGGVAHDLSDAATRLSLREVGDAVVEALVDTEELLRTINVLTEVNVVHLIDISFVHVSAEDHLDDVLGSSNSQQIESSEELVLRDVTVAGNVEVLEDGLKVNALVLDGGTVLFKDFLDLLLVLITRKVLSTGQKSVALGDLGNSSRGILVDSGQSESSVDVGAEVGVAEEPLGVSSLVFQGQGLELIVRQGEVHRGKDRFELVAGDATLSKLVEIAEEFFNSHTLHDDNGLKTVLNIGGVV